MAQPGKEVDPDPDFVRNLPDNRPPRYHSHFPSQYANGLLGPIVVSGPASANYDIDLGPFVISDWYYGAAHQIAHRVNSPTNPYIPGFPGSPPPSNNILFNGKNIKPTGPGGSYSKTTLTPGKKHLLRLINSSVQHSFSVSLVGHSFTIVATDMVPVQPTTVSSIYMGVGQRYDVIINANQPVANYWFNTTFSSGPCGQSNNPRPAAIFSYTGAPSANPTAAGTAPPNARCADSYAYAPVVTRSAPVASFTATPGTTLNTKLSINGAPSRVFWPVNDSPLRVSWNDPTLKRVQDGTTASLPAEANIKTVGPAANAWSFWLIQNNSSIPHPIHLHGHDLLILGASPALANPMSPLNRLRAYDPAADAAALRGANPTRRDSTVLPAWGWMAVAFRAGNPGAWLFHCHVAWHVGQGFGVQFLERAGDVAGSVGFDGLAAGCADWAGWYPASAPFLQDDSGV